MIIDLSSRVAVVTGAAHGIGRGVALGLAAAGAHVVAADIDTTAGAHTVSLVEEAGGSAELVEADVSSAGAMHALADHVRKHHGACHILVNNAGIAMFKGIVDTTEEDWDHLMGVDLKGVYLGTRALLPLLEAGAAATGTLSSVVCIASVHASLTVPWMTGYAAAKGGILAMVRSLSQELGTKGIRVNAVSPGFVRTPLYESWLATEADPAAAEQRVLDMLPLHRIADTSDIADMVVFLSSERARCVTGTNQLVDAGLTTRLMH